MPTPFSGGCSCGAIRYTCAAEPYVSYACHCTACRKRTSAAFGISLQVPSDGLTIDQGIPKTRVRIADSGNEMTRYFCPQCGSRLYGRNSGKPNLVSIQVGCLDDHSWFSPQIVLFTSRRHDWDITSEEVSNFEKMPPPSWFRKSSDGG